MAASKDPAVLLYIDKWLTSTAEMDADVRGWYLNLTLHNYDKGSLPAEVEKLALLAGVKFSEFARFETVFKDVLSKKFSKNEEGRLENPLTSHLIGSRERYKEKRSRAGNIGVVMKMAKDIKGYNSKYLDLLKKELFELFDEDIEQYKNLKFLEDKLEEYTGGSKTASFEELYPFVAIEWITVFKKWLQYKKDRREGYKTTSSIEEAYNRLRELSTGNVETAVLIIKQSIANNWAGMFELKNEFIKQQQKAPLGSKTEKIIEQSNRLHKYFDEE